MTKPFHVFISYAFEDEAIATEISNALTFRGLRVWFAPLSLKFGDKLLDSINAGLVASEYGLIILSPTYIAKSWTSYELDVLHRQHIEQDKKLFPLWHEIDKPALDKWNIGISGLFAMKSTAGASEISRSIAEVVYRGSPTVGIAPIWENPQWRFLQGKGELLRNSEDGGAFHLFEAAEFPDEAFPLYVYDQLYTKKEIILAVTKALFHGNPDVIDIGDVRREKMKKLCKQHGYDLDDPNFDAALHG
ncbi:toll/interleukin-1 receptor domain-containing protein [Duganella sp. PWIR1]